MHEILVFEKSQTIKCSTLCEEDSVYFLEILQICFSSRIRNLNSSGIRKKTSHM